jgi:hypothetical protein
VSDSTQSPYESKGKAFRWVLEMPGLDAYKVRAFRTLEKHFEIDFYYTADMRYGEYPVTWGQGRLKILDAAGNVTEEAVVRYGNMELLPFVNLDYSSSEGVIGRILLPGARLEWVGL